MLIIPAIDLKDGACVRLRQGLMEDATVFSDDPVAMAAKWVDGGCRRLHLVDLNGAFEGKPVNGMMQGCNVEATAALANATRIPVIASGGIHNLGDIQKLLDARTPGIIGAITGRAIYEGTLDVAEAQALCDNFKA